MSASRVSTVLVVWLPFFCAVGLAASTVQRSADCPSNCVIDLQVVVRLSDAGHQTNLLPQLGVNVVAIGSNRYLTRSKDGRHVLTLDSNGRLVDLLQGPSERPFKSISNVLESSDGGAIVYDFASKWLTTVGPDLKVRRTVPFPYPPTIALPGSGYILARQIPTADLVGRPLHILNADGVILRSFGNETDEYRADMALIHDRIAALSSDGMVWAAPLGRYLIQKWNPTSGTKLAEIRVRSQWFKASDRFQGPGQKPPAILEALWQDSDHLWVLLRDADVNWRRPERQAGERAIDWREFEKSYDSVLEVIDIRTGMVLGSRRFDRPLYGRAGLRGSFLLSSFEERADGVGEVTVVKPRLRKGTKQ